MDKNAIKKFATEARRELLHRIRQKALLFGISEELVNSGQWLVDREGSGQGLVASGQQSVDSIQLPDTRVTGELLTETEQAQRQALLQKILEDGYEQVMEEVAYTWFNRFSAIRFMEVNGYLPSKVRVFTDPDNRFQPEIITEAIHLDIDGLDMEKVFAYKEANDTEGLFRYLLITQCNALSQVLPGMFQPLADYTELLLPEGLLREDSVIRLMIDTVPEEDWRDAVQIIGWLYQYYNSEKKDEVFAALKKNVKITKDNIPAATQLFTPDWIVRYMVENSLGRTYIQYKLLVDSGQWTVDSEEERASREKEIAESLGWKYYLPEAKQTEAVREELSRLNPGTFDPMKLTLLDPCAGSGHILAYMFDVLVTIYLDYGYTTREAVRTIVSQNLCGLDIDERAAQLAYFTVMMKACQYDRRFLTRGIQPRVYAITESNHVGAFAKNHFAGENPSVKESFATLLEELRDAREYGSILTVTPQDWEALEARLNEMEHSLVQSDVKKLRNLLHVAETLSRKYDVVVTNPPYMGGSGMSPKLSAFVKKHYPNSKSDLFAVFIERCGEMTKKNGYQAMITQHAWMFLSSYEKLRKNLLAIDTVNMAHLGARAFEEIGGEVVQTTSFVMRKTHVEDYAGTYSRLIEPTTQQGKEDMFLSGDNRYFAKQSNFTKIPGSPVAYWVGEKLAQSFLNAPLREVAFAGIGMRTGDNDRFLRFWHEIDCNKFSDKCQNAAEVIEHCIKWVPYNKGGEFRKWYGNNDYVVNWENNGFEIKENTRRVYPQLGDNLGWKISNEKHYFKPGITWTVVSSKCTSFRRYYGGAIISNSGQSVISADAKLLDYLTGLLNTNISKEILAIISPTIGFESGYINKVPVIFDTECSISVCKLANDNISLSRADWDSYETSWDFKKSPLITSHYPLTTNTSDQLSAVSGQSKQNELTTSHYPLTTLSDCYENWKATCNNRFKQLQANEEELNRIFIDIYGLQEELTTEVADKDVTVHCIFDTKEDIPENLQGSNYVRTKRDEIVSFISYAVGSMLGRYSLEKDGLFYAGGDWKETLQQGTGGFTPDEDNVLPICDDEYFQDDIVGRLVEFVRVIYGDETLDENLEFISQALGGKKGEQPKDVIRNYFLKDFYKDHCKMYQKRPIYWLFDSGKKNGFKCLVYLHRYRRDTIARIRTDYIHPQQSRYRTILDDLESRMEDASTAEKVRLRKQIKLRSDQLMEIHEYEEKIHHLADSMISIDLDDGVKKNYAIFQDVLAKIK